MVDLIILSLLILVLGFDLWLELTGRTTISEYYQRLLPTRLDLVVLVGVVIGIYFAPIHIALKVVLSAIAGHLFWPNMERYRCLLRR